jgi:hypothetical protein
MRIMQKKIFNRIWPVLFLSALLLITSIPFNAIAEEDDLKNIKLTYGFNKPDLSQVEIQNFIYDRINLRDGFCAGKPGEPNIPSKGAYILLPPNSKVEDIQVLAKNQISMGRDYNIEPISEPIPISNPIQSVKIKKDSKIYNKNSFYPGKTYTYVGVYSFKGYNILVLQLHPVQYNPVSGELLYYDDFELTIKIFPDEKESLFRGLTKDKMEVMNKVDNPEIAYLYGKDMNQKFESFESYDLMILTTDELESGFTQLKNAHNSKGLKTVIKTLSDVGSSEPDDIREYIKDAYFNWGLNYVLLGGDIDIVPAKILWVFGLDEETTPYDTEMPSDLYYSCLDGPFNFDEDDKWGEPTDGEDGGDVDLYADVHVGRACVDDMEDVENFVSKTVAYLEKDPNDEYLKKVCFVGEYMGDHGIATWGGNYLDQMIDICSDDGYETVGFPSDEYTIYKLYDRDWVDNYWPPDELINVIDNSVHIVNHMGHCNYEYCMKMYYEDVYSYSNSDYCFIYSQGCMAGGFDCYYCDCFAEHVTVKTDTGAFAGIFNARYGWFWSQSTDGDSQRFHREFWDAIFNENIPEIGRANSDSKEDNIAIIGRSCIRWCYYQLNLFGDPSLQLIEFQNNPPETPTIEGARTGNVSDNYEYSITINDPDGDQMYLRVDWDDNTTSEWTELHNSGTTIKLTHKWDIAGAYIIKAMAKDVYGVESEWGTIEINIPRTKTTSTNIFEKLSHRLPNIAPLLRYIMKIFT